MTSADSTFVPYNLLYLKLFSAQAPGRRHGLIARPPPGPTAPAGQASGWNRGADRSGAAPGVCDATVIAPPLAPPRPDMA